MIIKVYPVRKESASGSTDVLKKVDYMVDFAKAAVSPENVDEIEVFGLQDPEVTRIEFYDEKGDPVYLYASTYRCDFQHIDECFFANAVIDAFESRGRTTPDSGVIAYHVIQSWPLDADIADEMVHQLGIALIKKLRVYPGLNVSHVHPELDMHDELHGKCKHNHLLISAYKLADYYEGGAVKYKNDYDDYAALMVINDSLALDHGCSIVQDPDIHKKKGYYENALKDQSWKGIFKRKIDLAKEIVSSWDEFEEYMGLDGYTLELKDDVTYKKFIDGSEKSVSGTALGKDYEEKNLLAFWENRKNPKEIEGISLSALWDLMLVCGPLVVELPLGPELGGDYQRPMYRYLLDPYEIPVSVYETYFLTTKAYKICTLDGLREEMVPGRVLLEYMIATGQVKGASIREDLHDAAEEWARLERQRKVCGEEELMQQIANVKKDYLRLKHEQHAAVVSLSDAPKVIKSGLDALIANAEARAQGQKGNSQKSLYKTRSNVRVKDYKVRKPGYYHYQLAKTRPYTFVETIILLFEAILKVEDYAWEYNHLIDDENEAWFGPVDWRLQRMADEICISHAMGCENPYQIQEWIDGTERLYNNIIYDWERSVAKHARDTEVYNAVEEYENTREIAERILRLEKGEEREKFEILYEDVINRYNSAKELMMKRNLLKAEEIEKFKSIYALDTKTISLREKHVSSLKTAVKEARLHRQEIAAIVLPEKTGFFEEEVVEDREIMRNYFYEKDQIERGPER